MNNQPIISVLMPVYNSQKYIRKAIKSILSQTFKDFELLIVDDGSFDNSVDIVNEFKDSRIKIFQKEHKGLVQTLNYGINQSTCEWIAIMHSDDISVNVRLEQQFNYIKNRINVLVGSSYYIIDENDKILYKTKLPERNNEIKEKLLFQNVIIHSSVMFNADHIKKHGGYHLINNTEDYDLWLRLFNDSEFYNFPTPLLYYRKHNNSLSSSRANKKYTDSQCYYVLKKNSINLIKQNDLELYEGIWNVLYKSVLIGRKLILKNISNNAISNRLKMKYLLMSLLGRTLIDLYYYFNPKLKLFYKFDFLLFSTRERI
jgi:glycosyltransferase involved in cell wall biosynthesis